MTIEEIKAQLVNAYMKYDPWPFLPFLMDEKVSVTYPEKIRFFELLKERFEYSKSKTEGKLRLKISPTNFYGDGTKALEYSFFDEMHKNPRFFFYIVETENSIFLEAPPF